jgi:predicted RNA polymerase sigma factor
VTLYDALQEVWPSPVVALNRTVAVSMVSGPARALEEVAELERDGRLARYPYLPAVKADLLRRLGRSQEASIAYRQALELTGNHAERAFLTARLARTHQGEVPPGPARVAGLPNRSPFTSTAPTPAACSHGVSGSLPAEGNGI